MGGLSAFGPALAHPSNRVQCEFEGAQVMSEHRSLLSQDDWQSASDTLAPRSKSIVEVPWPQSGSLLACRHSGQPSIAESTAPLLVSMQAGATTTVEPPPQVQHMTLDVKSSSSYMGSQEATPNVHPIPKKSMASLFVSKHEAARADRTATELVS